MVINYMENRYGRLFRAYWFVGWFLVAFFGLSNAHAIDTSQCGFLRCEQFMADNLMGAGPNDCNGIKPGAPAGSENSCECREVIGGSRVSLFFTFWNSGQMSTAEVYDAGLCNCSAQPPDPSDTSDFASSSGKQCRAGCVYRGNGPSVCTPFDIAAPAGPWSCSFDAGMVPTGNNCNPVHPGPLDGPPSNPPAPPVCVVADGGSTDCLTPLSPPPPSPPEICGSRNGVEAGCADLPGPDCGDGAGGATCAGNPPPRPPTPEPPLVTPPADAPPRTATSCSGEQCITVVVTITPPPVVQPSTCPSGTHGTPPSCVPDQVPCPDGSMPVGGHCPAPVGVCPDGTAPVNGQCNAPGSGGVVCPGGVPANAAGVCPDGNPGTCPTGQVSQNGNCYFNCSNGSPPVNGVCTAPVAPCPNGSAPVNGVCPVGVPCNPSTDPNHCAIPPPGHAGGGSSCSAAPFCSGNEIECSILQQQWQTRCALEGTLPVPQDGSNSHLPSEVQETRGFDVGSLDGSSWFGGGSCPDFGSLVVMGVTWTVGSPALCNFFLGIGGLFQLLCAFKAVRIAVAG